MSKRGLLKQIDDILGDITDQAILGTNPDVFVELSKLGRQDSFRTVGDLFSRMINFSFIRSETTRE